MEDFKLIGKCKGCKRKRLFIRKRKLTTPIGIVTSQDLICTRCYTKLVKAI